MRFSSIKPSIAKTALTHCVVFGTLAYQFRGTAAAQAVQDVKPVTQPAESATLTDEQVTLQIDVLKLVWNDVEREKLSSPPRQKFLREFLAKSEIVRRFPEKSGDAGRVWVLRALAGLELNQRRTAWEAGEAMIRLKMDVDGGEFQRKVLAYLERDGLLDPKAGDPTKFTRQRETLEAARRAANPKDAVRADEILAPLLMEAPDYEEAAALRRKIKPMVEESLSKNPMILTGNAFRVAYVCDASGSMMGAFGDVQVQMHRAIELLSETKRFNVSFFSSNGLTTVNERELVAASPENKQSAYKLIENARASGEGDPTSAIKAAFAQNPHVVMLLTDGFQLLDEKVSVVDLLRELNKDKRVRVDCVYFRFSDDKSLEQTLKTIVDENGGSLRTVKFGEW